MENGTGTPYRAGFAAVMGRPNVGKSTLINALMGQKIAAVSPRPQTTRRRQLGILTLDDVQIIFADTPGVHQPRNKLGENMNQMARDTLENSDLILFMVDASGAPTEEDRLLADMLIWLKDPPPLIMVLNKIDLLPTDALQDRQQAYFELLPPMVQDRAKVVPVSAFQGLYLDVLLKEITGKLPNSEALFPEGQITDLYERDLAGDLVREAALIHLRDEVPHGITVRVDEFTERNEHGAYIAATIFVERESHKPIVIGQGGEMLKRIGSTARKEIENMSGRKVYLKLRVKVRKNWRNDEKILRWFGYSGKG
jgi:GTPase